MRDLVGHPLRTTSTRDGGIWTFQLGSKLGLNWSKQLAWKMGSKVSDIFTLSIAENQKLGTWERTGFDVVEQSRGWNSRGRLAEPLKTPERHEMQRRVRARRQKSDETASRLPTLRARAGRLARGGASRGGGLFPPALFSVCCSAFDCYFLTAVFSWSCILALLLSPLHLVSTPSCSCPWYFEAFDLAV